MDIKNLHTILMIVKIRKALSQGVGLKQACSTNNLTIKEYRDVVKSFSKETRHG